MRPEARTGRWSAALVSELGEGSESGERATGRGESGAPNLGGTVSGRGSRRGRGGVAATAGGTCGRRSGPPRAARSSTTAARRRRRGERPRPGAVPRTRNEPPESPRPRRRADLWTEISEPPEVPLPTGPSPDAAVPSLPAPPPLARTGGGEAPGASSPRQGGGARGPLRRRQRPAPAPDERPPVYVGWPG